jgi:hypothetical protein
MTFAPAILPALLALADELDDGSRSIAEVWRELGVAARAQRLFQPSYESVRRLVHTIRARRRETYSRVVRALVLTAEYLLNTRPRASIVDDVWSGADIERRRERYRWKRL